MKTIKKITSKAWLRILFFVMLLFGGTLWAQAQKISPYLVGNNYWMPGTMMTELMKPGGLVDQADIQTIRIGGFGPNGWSDAQHLEYIRRIKAMGALPIVQVRASYSAQQAIDFITLINKTNNLGVRVWSIGNEPDHPSGGSKSDAEIADYTKRIAAALKSVDPTITVIALEFSGYSSSRYGNLIGGANSVTGLVPGKDYYYVDVIGFHRYVITDVSQLMGSINDLVGKIAAANASRPEGKKLKWGMGEFNSHYNNDLTGDPNMKVWSFNNGQFHTELFGVGMQKSAFSLDSWSMIEGPDRSGTDLSLFDKNYAGRSTYWHSLMFGQNMKQNYLTSNDNQTGVGVVAMGDATGAAVMIINKSGTAYNFSLNLNNATPAANALTISVNAGINKEITGNIGATTTQMLVFCPDGTLLKRYTYSKANCDARAGAKIEVLATDCTAGPSATITSPVNNSTFVPGSTIAVTGTASTPSGTTISNVKVYDDATLLGTATGTTNWSYSWTNVPAAATHNITAVVTNNSGQTGTSAIVTINDGSHVNLALNKPVTVSSTESAAYAGSYAVDGVLTTRWASLFADPQWISIDLQAKYDISQVKLFWEAASAKAFQIQVSTDNVTWTSIYSTTTGAGGNQTLDITGTGRYIRMYGTARNTAYGYSLFEFEVYGTLAADIHVTGVTVTPETATVGIGAAVQLTATVAPANANNKNVTWSTSNAAVATVSATGLVSGLTAGTATITATTQDGGFTDASVVTVTIIPVTGVSVTPPTATINIGATAQLTATVAPANATNKNVTWSTSDATVATVSTSGLVSGIKGGSATVTATTQDGGFTASCAVTVNAVLINIAKNKPVTVSSTESAAYPGSYAVDGSTTTRWASLFADPQWISVNLQASYDISQVKLNWEAASAKAFQIQVSNDNVNWVSIYSTTTGAGGIQTLNVTGTGSYIRMYGTVRNTAYGYSLFEFEVYGTPAAPTPVTGVTVTPTTATIDMTATAQLTATVAPANATNKNVTWSTSNVAVATVSATGLVTGVNEGTATITATTQDGGYTSTCAVTVNPHTPDPWELNYYLFVDVWTADYMRTTGATSIITQLESATVPTSTLCQWEFRAAPTSGYYHILNRSTGNAIQPTGGVTTDNATISQVALTPANAGNTELQWSLEPYVGTSYYWIKNRKSGLYIRPNAGTNGTGVNIVQNILNTTYSSFRWNLVSQGLKSAFVNPETEEITGKELTVFPNPVFDELQIQNADQNSTIEVYNLSGKLVLVKKLDVDNNALNVSMLKSGLYILKATGNNKTSLFKFIKR